MVRNSKKFDGEQTNCRIAEERGSLFLNPYCSLRDRVTTASRVQKHIANANAPGCATMFSHDYVPQEISESLHRISDKHTSTVKKREIFKYRN